MTRRIGIALIGLGPGSEPHAKSLVELANRVEVRAAVSRSAERAAAFSSRFPFVASTDLDAALADPLVDAVFVLTPPNAHLEIAEAALKAGKHVLVEKPLEMSVARGERLVAAARTSGKRLGVVLQHRFRPGGRRLKAVLESGRLGPVEAASVSVPWWRPQSYYDVEGRGTRARDGGGVLITQGIHAIDLFRHLVGVTKVEAAQVTTTGLHRMETEDFAAALVRLGNGAPGQIMATSAFNPGLPERIEVIGRHGSASLVGGTLAIDYIDGRDERVQSEGGTGSGANIMDFPIDAHLALITDFLDAIVEDRDPAVTGEEALATQKLLEDILARGGGA